MKKKYLAYRYSLYWFYAFVVLSFTGLLIYGSLTGEKIWGMLFSLFATFVFVLMVTVKEYRISEQIFLEIHYALGFAVKPRKIPISSIISLRKIRKNQLRINKIKGFEVIKVRESEIDEMIKVLKSLNPSIKTEDND